MHRRGDAAPGVGACWSHRWWWYRLRGAKCLVLIHGWWGLVKYRNSPVRPGCLRGGSWLEDAPTGYQA